MCGSCPDSLLFDSILSCKVIWQVARDERYLFPGDRLLFCLCQDFTSSFDQQKIHGKFFNSEDHYFKCPTDEERAQSVSLKHFPFFQDSCAFIWNWSICSVSYHGGHQPHTKLRSVVLKHLGLSGNSLTIIMTLEAGSKYSHSSGKVEGWAQRIQMQLQFGSGAMKAQ